MEARVYAEDAFNGFLPQAGTATFVHWSDHSARNDEALASGQTVGTSYDPMLGQGHRARPDPGGRAHEARSPPSTTPP